MLGRTDSRARAILLLLVFVVVAGALGVRLAYWQVLRRDELAAMAVKQSSMTVELPAKRGSIYDRSGTVVLATSVQRDRLAANPKLLTPERRAAGRDHARRLLGLAGRGRASTSRARMTSEREYVVLARGLDARAVGPDPRAVAGDRADARRPDPRAGAGAALPAARRRARRRRSPRTCSASSTARGPASTASSSTTRTALAGTPRIVAAQRDAAGNEVPDSSTVIERARPARTCC